MKRYLYYTLMGTEQAPDGSEAANCQILGSVEARTPQIGLKKLLKENPWIEGKGYFADKIKWKITIDESDMEEIATIINYLYNDNAKNRLKGNIGEHLQTLIKSLELSENIE